MAGRRSSRSAGVADRRLLRTTASARRRSCRPRATGPPAPTGRRPHVRERRPAHLGRRHGRRELVRAPVEAGRRPGHDVRRRRARSSPIGSAASRPSSATSSPTAPSASSIPTPRSSSDLALEADGRRQRRPLAAAPRHAAGRDLSRRAQLPARATCSASIRIASRLLAQLGVTSDVRRIRRHRRQRQDDGVEPRRGRAAGARPAGAPPPRGRASTRRASPRPSATSGATRATSTWSRRRSSCSTSRATCSSSSRWCARRCATGDIVIADRFLYTAEVLGRNGRHLPRGVHGADPRRGGRRSGARPRRAVRRRSGAGPRAPKGAKLAAADRRPPARKGLAGVGLQHRLRRGYLELAAASPQRWAVVDNDEPLEDTVARVTELIDAAHRGGASAGRSIASARDAERPARARRPSRLPATPADALPLFPRAHRRAMRARAPRRGAPARRPGRARRRRTAAAPRRAGSRGGARRPDRPGRRRELGAARAAAPEQTPRRPR